MDPAPTPLWLSHHHPESYDRCVVIGRRHVCRRCLVLYPVALVIAAVIVAGARAPQLEIAAMWLLPIGVVVEWVGEHVGGWAHNPRRLVALSAIAAIGAGVALGRHMLHPFETAALLPMLVIAAVCGISALWGSAVTTARLMEEGWEADHEAEERARWDRLRDLADVDSAE